MFFATVSYFVFETISTFLCFETDLCSDLFFNGHPHIPSCLRYTYANTQLTTQYRHSFLFLFLYHDNQIKRIHSTFITTPLSYSAIKG